MNVLKSLKQQILLFLTFSVVQKEKNLKREKYVSGLQNRSSVTGRLFPVIPSSIHTIK